VAHFSVEKPAQFRVETNTFQQKAATQNDDGSCEIGGENRLSAELFPTAIHGGQSLRGAVSA
jgi:hypothetical protein